MMIVVAAIILMILTAGVAFARILRRKNVDIILRARIAARHEAYSGTRHVFVSIVDHFEPFWHNRDVARARERVRRWADAYPRIAERFRDDGGNPPRHAFFYPEEEYPLDPSCMDMLAGVVRQGFGEVEVHLHHDGDTAGAMRSRLLTFTRTLHDRHGLLHEGADADTPAYAFIHGNWVLGNSGPGGRNCGVDDELVVLRETGCYADFTLPAAPHPSQPPVVNRIYYAAGDHHRPRAHFRAIDARYATPSPPGPLIVTGPLALNWRRRRRGLMPAVENGDLTGINPPAPDRTDLWIECGISVAGFPRWTFVKAYTHGAQEKNAARLLGADGGLASLFADLLARYNDGTRYVLHFTTPWEIFQAVRILESGDEAAIRAVERFEHRF
ncbi:MAG TPA: hypothetical protein VFX92_12355 [Candidatus Krumholzibacteria bacterium]|nr:hypothetical protein [Candidatus Krumholzibacteria bacterium]